MALSLVGHLIAFEGIDGSGKTTQVTLLADRLERDHALHVELIHEPGGTSLGEELRQVLTQDRGIPISPLAELFLFNAARAQLMDEVVLPALAAGKVVVCDRFSASTRAYQGYGRGLDLDLIHSQLQAATQGVEPELTVLLDLEVQVGLKRKRGQRSGTQLSLLDRFEDEDVSFGERVREGYLKLALADPDRWQVLNASGSVKQVAEAVWERVSRLLHLG